MKLIDIANKIDKSEQNRQWVDTDDIGYELRIDNVPCVEQDRLKCYWVGNWYCTDSYVGYRMYFFDDEPAAFSIQLGRKCEESFHWFTLELAKKVREYLLSLNQEKELNISICDINEDIGDSYKIEFNEQILNFNRAKLNNEKVEILEKIKHTTCGIDTKVKIKLPDGEEKHVDINDLNFDFHITE
ncbi:hypothetical protein [Bacillus halotolerans]|uniref:hypothetical protein n=1 Tax=Bacillus halotolerans TaxID=260554 RepID=UPI000D03E708|nr:hypothetical protein [Bacillus halotolerans]PRS01365.1 hypothetical protein C6W26_17635 [Bacillus halotolerans]QKS04775.1 hypothetical protein HT135_10975 [Bacillus halotolerans]